MSIRNQQLYIDGLWKDKAERMRKTYVKLKMIRFKCFKTMSPNTFS